MIIGAHVSAAGGVKNAIARASELGVTAIQIFASAPGNWNPPKTTPEEAEAYRVAAKSAGITHTFFHSIYLINLASDKPELVEKSKQSLVSALNLNAAMGGNGVIFHVGSSKERSFDDVRDAVINNINDILAASDEKATLIIETNAGQGNCIGDTFEEVASLVGGVREKSRIGVCLDTAHTFASGYDLVTRGAQDVINEFDRVIGLQYLKAIHTNDSKTAFNSKVDRHENIGYGTIGHEPFRQLLHIESLRDIPFILEVPGIDGGGPDRANVATLQELAQ